jgi:hypothetical protein
LYLKPVSREGKGALAQRAVRSASGWPRLRPLTHRLLAAGRELSRPCLPPLRHSPCVDRTCKVSSHADCDSSESTTRREGSGANCGWGYGERACQLTYPPRQQLMLRSLYIFRSLCRRGYANERFPGTTCQCLPATHSRTLMPTVAPSLSRTFMRCYSC